MQAALTFKLEGVLKTSRDSPYTDFEGPLDLILFLLSKDKIEIQNLKIALLLEQYLAYLDLQKRMDLEIASEFIAMASHLVYLKSRMLLTAGEESDSEMDEFLRALEERKRREEYESIQAAVSFMSARASWGRDFFTKVPEPITKDPTHIRKHNVVQLSRTLKMMSMREARRLPPPPSAFAGIVGHEPYPVHEKIRQLLSFLTRKSLHFFKSLIRASQSRSEAVATFLAVLELCRGKKIAIEPDGDDYSLSLASEPVGGNHGKP